jgi:hypothetical protein
MGYYSKAELIRCSLCGGTLPAFDVETQIEHMAAWHKAPSMEDARAMVSQYFTRGQTA